MLQILAALIVVLTIFFIAADHLKERSRKRAQVDFVEVVKLCSGHHEDLSEIERKVDSSMEEIKRIGRDTGVVHVEPPSTSGDPCSDTQKLMAISDKADEVVELVRRRSR